MYLSKMIIYGTAIVILVSIGLSTGLFFKLNTLKGQTSSQNQLNENVKTFQQNENQPFTKHSEKPIVESQTQEKPKCVEVSVNDIRNGDVRIMGKTGYLNGDLVTIRGVWRNPPGLVKDFFLRFEVTHVNGKMLSDKVEIIRYQVKWFKGEESPEWKPVAGEIWELQGVEIPVFQGIPHGFNNSKFGGPQTASIYDGFTTVFEYAIRRKIEAKPSKPASS